MSSVVTKTQVSAGGVIFRRLKTGVKVALISVGQDARWQLPKGLVGKGESNEEAALREAREETGLTAELVAHIDTVEYWYFSTERGTRTRFHKFVHFYLLRYVKGSVRDHDHEVNEARWAEIGKAIEMLAFKTEKQTLARACEMIEKEMMNDELKTER